MSDVTHLLDAAAAGDRHAAAGTAPTRLRRVVEDCRRTPTTQRQRLAPSRRGRAETLSHRTGGCSRAAEAMVRGRVPSRAAAVRCARRCRPEAPTRRRLEAARRRPADLAGEHSPGEVTGFPFAGPGRNPEFRAPDPPSGDAVQDGRVLFSTSLCQVHVMSDREDRVGEAVAWYFQAAEAGGIARGRPSSWRGTRTCAPNSNRSSPSKGALRPCCRWPPVPARPDQDRHTSPVIEHRHPPLHRTRTRPVARAEPDPQRHRCSNGTLTPLPIRPWVRSVTFGDYELLSEIARGRHGRRGVRARHRCP